jgi:hypothetical protein
MSATEGTVRTRRQALRAALAGGAGLGAASLAGAWSRPDASAGESSPAQDARIMSFLLTLEETQAAFYEAAVRSGALQGDLLEFARVVAPQERQHVQLLRRRLGGDAGPAPRLGVDRLVRDPGRFRTSAIDLEELVAAAYIGQGPSLTAGPMQDAARIVAVEARHAAWIRDLAGEDPAPHPADAAQQPRDVLAQLRTKGFIR